MGVRSFKRWVQAVLGPFEYDVQLIVLSALMPQKGESVNLDSANQEQGVSLMLRAWTTQLFNLYSVNAYDDEGKRQHRVPAWALHTLLPAIVESQVAVLAAMTPEQRGAVLAAMTAEQRAAVLAAMPAEERAAAEIEMQVSELSTMAAEVEIDQEFFSQRDLLEWLKNAVQGQSDEEVHLGMMAAMNAVEHVDGLHKRSIVESGYAWDELTGRLNAVKGTVVDPESLQRTFMKKMWSHTVQHEADHTKRYDYKPAAAELYYQSGGAISCDADKAAREATESPLHPPEVAVVEPEPAPGADSKIEAILEMMFERYDLDESGLIDSDDELQQLCTNLLYKFQVSIDRPELDRLDALVEKAGVADDPMDLPSFKEWWRKHFAAVVQGKKDLLTRQI